MKTKAMLKKTITIIAFLLLVEVSFSQQQGFFQLFEDERSLLVRTAIEANEGCYIFVQNEENFVSKCELVKLSEEGNLLKRADSTLYLPTLITIDKLFNMGQNLKKTYLCTKNLAS